MSWLMFFENPNIASIVMEQQDYWANLPVSGWIAGLMMCVLCVITPAIIMDHWKLHSDSDLLNLDTDSDTPSPTDSDTPSPTDSDTPSPTGSDTDQDTESSLLNEYLDELSYTDLCHACILAFSKLDRKHKIITALSINRNISGLIYPSVESDETESEERDGSVFTSDDDTPPSVNACVECTVACEACDTVGTSGTTSEEVVGEVVEEVTSEVGVDNGAGVGVGSSVQVDTVDAAF